MEPKKTPFWGIQIPSVVTFPRGHASLPEGKERRQELDSGTVAGVLSEVAEP